MESTRRPHILVVDDNLTIRNLVATILGEQGMEVAAASDGREALAYLERRRPDLMLLDLSMPHIDGLEVLRRIREHPTLRDLRIVMLTAAASTPRFKEVNVYQPDGYVEKPFRINDLVDQVKRALNRQLPDA
jgi:CheY-like chemotaxis protein